MLFSLGAGVKPTEGCPAGSHWAELYKRGHRQWGLLVTGAKREPHEQSKGVMPVMCVCGVTLSLSDSVCTGGETSQFYNLKTSCLSQSRKEVMSKGFLFSQTG